MFLLECEIGTLEFNLNSHPKLFAYAWILPCDYRKINRKIMNDDTNLSERSIIINFDKPILYEVELANRNRGSVYAKSTPNRKSRFGLDS
jgi:hypothetical protein